ncbi:MAG: hypothetical protein DCC49_13310 [Acidobacteria bacterium]|nr:MAG: hypothetical protein DCC49_13310 [Acidobacteriota bacterium]
MILSDWLAFACHHPGCFNVNFPIPKVIQVKGRATRRWRFEAENNLDALGRSIQADARAGYVDARAGRDRLGHFPPARFPVNACRGLSEAGHSAQAASKGSGAVEHEIDLFVAIRFKHQGRGHGRSRASTTNLLASRALARDEAAWRGR